MANIELINYLNVPPKVVYRALTTQKGLSEIWTSDCTVKAEIGFIDTFGFGEEDMTKLKTIKLLPNKEIIWECMESDPEWIGTTISFELEKRDGGTSVTLTHAGWEKVSKFYRWCNYNWGFFLYSLKQYCEEGEGIPFQKRTF